MLNVKQESCEYNFLSLLVWLDEIIEPGSTDYEADILTTRPRAGYIRCGFFWGYQNKLSILNLPA